LRISTSEFIPAERPWYGFDSGHFCSGDLTCFAVSFYPPDAIGQKLPQGRSVLNIRHFRGTAGLARRI
jgi:hypothetical protein